MGVEMRIFAIPRDNTFRPDGASLASFVEQLRAGHWIIDPASPAFASMRFEGMRHYKHAKKTGAIVITPASVIDRVKKGAGYAPFPKQDLERWFTEHDDADLQIDWPVVYGGPSPALRYPLNEPSPLDASDTYYDVELRLGRDYVHVTGENIDFDDEACACGASLRFEHDDDVAMYRVCPSCGAAFDPATRKASVRDPWTGETSRVPGGATFRFALAIDCGKCWPNVQGLGFAPELSRLCETHFARPFYQVIEVH